MGNSCWACPPSPVLQPSAGSELSRPVPTLQQAASTQQYREGTGAEVTDAVKSPVDRQLLRTALSTHTVFSCLDEQGREAVVTCMKLMRVPAREFLVEQGFKAAYYFVLASGKAEITVDKQPTRLLLAGEGFGEEALLHSAKRTFSVRTLSESRFWALDRINFRRFVETVNARALRESDRFVRSLPVFRELTEFQLEALICSCTVRKFAAGQVILQEGTKGDCLYLLQEGSVECSHAGQLLRQLHAGALFGELAYLSGGKRTATVTALSQVLCLSIAAKQLVAALGSCVQSVLYANSISAALEQSGLSQRLSTAQRDRMVHSMRIESFDQDSIVVPSGTVLSDGLWIVLQGTLSGLAPKNTEYCTCFGLETTTRLTTDITVCSDTADVAWLERREIEDCLGCAWPTAEAFAALAQLPLFHCLPEEALILLARKCRLVQVTCPQTGFFLAKSGGPCFGLRHLLSCGNEEVVVTSGDYWTLSKADFTESLSLPLQELLRRRLELLEGDIALQDLHPTRILGRGMFGLVFEVQHQRSQTYYALKTISRSTIARYNLHHSVLQERSILLKLDHQLIARLIRTFKDSKRLYFLQELVHGIDFYEILRVLGVLSNQQAQFYAGSLILVLEYMHSRNIVYRDLKPENFMVDESGYIKLVDFGTAKVLSGRTFSMVGTPHYMAPEMILGKGYGLAVDLWSLGVVIYEMVSGMVPFAEEVDDPYAIYEKILDHMLVFPEYVRADCRAVVEQLLSPDPTYRSNNDTLSLRRHKWLQGFDWTALKSRTLQAPYLPQTIVAAADQLTSLDMEEEETSDSLSAPPNWDADF